MKLNFRKISAIATSLLLSGMSAGFAAAANYPAPFVTNGVADAAVVYGTGTGVSTLDSVNAINIQQNLASSVTGGTVTIEGDNILLDRASDHLNLGNTLSGPFGTTVDAGDLDLLADGVYKADDSDEFDYEQKITLGSPELAHFQDSDYEDLIGVSQKTPTIGINVTSSQFIMNYSLDFLDDAESDVVSGRLDDLEGSFIPLLGKEFFVSTWQNGTGVGTTGKLTLLDSAAKGVVKEGETTTVIVDGVTYEVSIDYIDSNSAKLNVNGQVTSDLTSGQTEKVSGEVYVGLTEITRLEVSGEVGTVEFNIGKGKLELTDSSDIVLNGDTVQDVKAYLRMGTPNGAASKVDKITIEWKASDDMFITPESSIEMPGFGGIKFSMTELVRGTEGEEKVTVKYGSNKIELTAPIKDGEAKIGLLYSNDTAGWIGIGEEATKRLATSPINRLTFWDQKVGSNHHEYFVASYNDSKNAESYLLDFVITTDGTRKEVDIINEITQETIASDKTDGDTVTIGDVQFTIENITMHSGQNRSVNITAGTNVNFNTLYTVGGLRIYLPYATGSGFENILAEGLANSQLHGVYPDLECGGGTEGIGCINVTGAGASDTVASEGHSNKTWYLTMDGEDKDDNLASGSAFELSLSSDIGSGNEEEVNQVNTTGTFGGSGGVQGKEVEAIGQNVYQAYVYDDVAPRLLHYTNGDQDYAEVYYPSKDSETYAKVYLSSAAAETSTSGKGVMLVTDDEVSSVSNKNLIVVGGSCINTAAAALVGGNYCGSAWTSATGVGTGKFTVKAYPTNSLTSKLAILAAGYESAETTSAATYVTTQTYDTSTVSHIGPTTGVTA